MRVGGVGDCGGEVHAEAFGCSGAFDLGAMLVERACTMDDNL